MDVLNLYKQLRWYYSQLDLIDNIHKFGDNILLFVRYEAFEYNCETERLEMIERKLCPAKVTLTNDTLEWYINDFNPLCDTLEFETKINDPKIRNKYLGYHYADNRELNADNKNPEFNSCSIGIVSAFAVVSTAMSEPNFGVSLHKRPANRIQAALDPEECNAVTAIINECIKL